MRSGEEDIERSVKTGAERQSELSTVPAFDQWVPSSVGWMLFNSGFPETLVVFKS